MLNIKDEIEFKELEKENKKLKNKNAKLEQELEEKERDILLKLFNKCDDYTKRKLAAQKKKLVKEIKEYIDSNRICTYDDSDNFWAVSVWKLNHYLNNLLEDDQLTISQVKNDNQSSKSEVK